MKTYLQSNPESGGFILGFIIAIVGILLIVFGKGFWSECLALPTVFVGLGLARIFSK